MEYNDKITWFPPLAPYSPKMEEVIRCTIDTITFRGSFTILPQCLPFSTIFIKNGKWYVVSITEIIRDESKPDILKLRYCIKYELDSAKNPDREYDDTANRIEFIQRHGKSVYRTSQYFRRERGEDVEVPEDSDDELGSEDSFHCGCCYDPYHEDPYCGFLPPGVTYDETDKKYYYDDASSEESFHCGCCYDPDPNEPADYDCEQESNLRKEEGNTHHTKKQKYKRGKPSLQAREARAQITEHKHRVLRNQIVSEKKSDM